MTSRLLPGVADAGAKRFRAGTHRTAAPAETLERVSALLVPMGITRVSNITGLDHVGIPVVAVCRPNSRSLSVSQGKGIDLDSAKASGIMEAIEAYHAERIVQPLKLASMRELEHTHTLLPIDLLPLLSISRFHPDLRLLWIEGFDLIGAHSVWLPYELVHLNVTLPLPEGSGCFQLGSNGLASGNHMLEAVLHGACEVIERDAYGMWRLSADDQRACRRVQPETIDDPACNRVLEQFQAAGLAVGVWDLTSDIGVATFRCEIIAADAAPFRPAYPTAGLGCHPQRDIALLRALTEAAQSRLTLISGARDDLPRSVYDLSENPEALAHVHGRLRDGRGLRDFKAAPSHDGSTFQADLEWLIGRLEAAEVTSLVVVDLSIKGLGIAVARVVMPGLEGNPDAPAYAARARGRSRALGLEQST